MALLQSIWGESLPCFIPFSSLLSYPPTPTTTHPPTLSTHPPSPPRDILIVNALEQRVKHSQRQSEVNKNTFLPFPPALPQEAILKIVNNKHSYHEYISSISLADKLFFFLFFFKNNFFLKTSLEILLQRCQHSYH